MKLIITDDGPVHEAKMAKAFQRHKRNLDFKRLCAQGHVTVNGDRYAGQTTVKVGDETFQESYDIFPSEVLMARLHLAIRAGQSGMNEVHEPLVYADVASSWGGRAGGESLKTLIEQYPKRSGICPEIADLVTATVKKFRRGLRP